MRLLTVLISLNQPNNIILIKCLQDRNILDVSCFVACYITIMHYFLPLRFFCIRRLRDPYISFAVLFICLMLLQSTRSSSSLFLRPLSACIIFYTHIYVMLLYRRYVCDVFSMYTCTNA